MRTQSSRQEHGLAESARVALPGVSTHTHARCQYIAPTHCTPRADATRFYEDEAGGILYVYEDTSFGERKVAGLLAFFNGGVIDMDVARI